MEELTFDLESNRNFPFLDLPLQRSSDIQVTQSTPFTVL